MIKQFIRFGMIGAFNSILNYIIYIVCIECGLHYMLANVIGFVIVIFNAYLLQSRYVFELETKKYSPEWWKLLLKTYISYAFTGLILTNIFSYLWIDVIELSPFLYPIYVYTKKYFRWKSWMAFREYFAPFMNCITMMPINFMINKLWTFR